MNKGKETEIKMEVHAHSHTPRKKWTHYIWEFLMLFPAVLIAMEGDNAEIIRTTENPPLRTTDQELLQELSLFTVYLRGTKNGILRVDKELEIAGVELIEYLKKEYRLK